MIPKASKFLDCSNFNSLSSFEAITDVCRLGWFRARLALKFGIWLTRKVGNFDKASAIAPGILDKASIFSPAIEILSRPKNQ